MANFNNFDLRKFLAENKVTKAEDVTPEVEELLREELEAESLNEGLKDLFFKAIDKLFGIDKFQACMDSNWEGAECEKLKQDMAYSKVKSGFEKQSGATPLEEETAELTKEETFKKEIKDILDS